MSDDSPEGAGSGSRAKHPFGPTGGHPIFDPSGSHAHAAGHDDLGPAKIVRQRTVASPGRRLAVGVLVVVVLGIGIGAGLWIGTGSGPGSSGNGTKSVAVDNSVAAAADTSLLR